MSGIYLYNTVKENRANLTKLAGLNGFPIRMLTKELYYNTMDTFWKLL